MPDAPRVGDRVWKRSRFNVGYGSNGYILSQPNGVVNKIKRWDEEATISYWDGDVDFINLGDFDGCWTDRFGGIWRLE